MSEYRTITEWLTTGDGRALTNYHKTQLLEMAAQYEQTILAWQRDALDWRGEYEATAALVADLARARRGGSAAAMDGAIGALVERYGLHVSNAGVARVVGGVWGDVPISSAARYRAALEEIRADCGKVCADFATCDHAACNSSYSAWQIADTALGEVSK